MSDEADARGAVPVAAAKLSVDEPPPVPPDRLSTLADGVFAIAMTLLVLGLSVPIVTADELTEALSEMWPEFLMYALSFLVLGVYWLIHHMIYDAIDRYDPTLAWLNIVYLMFAALIPFSTALIVEHGALTITALLYGLNMLALFFTAWAMWTYATTNRRLVASHIDDGTAHGGRTMGLVYFAVLAVSIALAFVSPTASMVVYAAIVMAFIGFTVVGRWEAVTVWPKWRKGS
jgi:uncharacterized membrane protein